MAITKATASSAAPAAKGDLVVGSATNDAAILGVGTASQVLTVDSSTDTGLKWAAPSSGAMTKITSARFDNVATVDIDNCLTTTYYSYVIKIWAYSNLGATEDLYWRFRYGGTTQTSAYSAGGMRQDRNDASPTAMNSDNAGQWLLTNHMGASDTEFTYLTVNLVRWLSNGRAIFFSATGSSPSSDTPAQILLTGGMVGNGENYDGFRLLSSSGNITGRYEVYGLQQ